MQTYTHNSYRHFTGRRFSCDLWNQWRFSKMARSTSECQILEFPAMHHAFCMFCTLVLHSWRFRCTNTTSTVVFYCICITLSIWSSQSTCALSMTKACLLCLLYDWGVLATLVMCLYCSHGALPYNSTANCPIPSFIYWSSDVMDLLGHAAAIQICHPPRRPPTGNWESREKKTET